MGVGVGAGVRAGVGCVGSVQGNDELMDACMDGTTLDGIHPATNSTVRSFTEYHDDSCARLNASINSRVVHQIRGAAKRFTTGTGCKATLPAEKKLAFSQQESARVHDETWAGNESLRLTISQAEEIQPRCAVSVFPPADLFFHSRATWARQ